MTRTFKTVLPLVLSILVSTNVLAAPAPESEPKDNIARIIPAIIKKVHEVFVPEMEQKKGGGRSGKGGRGGRGIKSGTVIVGGSSGSAASGSLLEGSSASRMLSIVVGGAVVALVMV